MRYASLFYFPGAILGFFKNDTDLTGIYHGLHAQNAKHRPANNRI